ncbi:hypothetical protein C4579_02555 [Candidatus Microgenomates bacterium]|nr:MAG: hypothetical protein C4579_02555 [Candidatus Microgenomates bacterium]
MRFTTTIVIESISTNSINIFPDIETPTLLLFQNEVCFSRKLLDEINYKLVIVKYILIKYISLYIARYYLSEFMTLPITSDKYFLLIWKIHTCVMGFN